MKSLRARAAPTATVMPVSDPYGLPHPSDAARCTDGLATDAQQAELHRLIDLHQDTETNIELLWDWSTVKVRTADGEWRTGRRSGLEVQSCINYLKAAAV